MEQQKQQEAMGASNKPALFAYASVKSLPEGVDADSTLPEDLPPREFIHTLEQLKNLSMNESWDYSYATGTKKHPILHNYLLHTFARVQEEGKVLELDPYSCFNTGLVTPNQEEIFMLFKKSKKTGYRFFHSFCKSSSNLLVRFNPLPERASYFSDATELIYDTKLPLRIQIDHIIEDPDNIARFPEDIRSWSKLQLQNTFNGAIEHAIKRVKRNYLTAIPQYYRGNLTPTAHLQLLLPLCLRDPAKADLALAVYKKDGTYNGRTCLTLDMAINNARLITKPDDEWLKP
jgi:hypothetical protein